MKRKGAAPGWSLAGDCGKRVLRSIEKRGGCEELWGKALELRGI